MRAGASSDLGQAITVGLDDAACESEQASHPTAAKFMVPHQSVRAVSAPYLGNLRKTIRELVSRPMFCLNGIPSSIIGIAMTID